MRNKTLICVLVYLFLIIFPSCKENSTTPDIRNLLMINSFTANPTKILYGKSSTLSWSISNAKSVEIDQGIGPVPSSGSKEVSPEETTTYTLTAKNNDGQKTKTCRVEVKARAIMVLDGDLQESYTLSGSPRFEGYVKNIGNMPCHMVIVTITCYSDEEKTTIIDVAYAFPSNLGYIMPGQRVYFEAIASEANSHKDIKAIDIKIDWVDSQSNLLSQIHTFILSQLRHRENHKNTKYTLS